MAAGGGGSFGLQPVLGIFLEKFELFRRREAARSYNSDNTSRFSVEMYGIQVV